MLNKYSIVLTIASILSIASSSFYTNQDLDEYVCPAEDDAAFKRFPSQMTVYNLNESLLNDLKLNYKEKMVCLFKFVESSLTEMNHVYDDIASSTETSIATENPGRISFVKKSDKKKSKKFKVSENFLGQFGIFAYSISQNHTIGHFRHESIKYMRPSNETSDVESMEADLFKYRNDINVLKKLLAYLKSQEKEVIRKLKNDSKEKEKAERDLARVAKEAAKLEKERQKEEKIEKSKVNDFKTEMKSQL